MTTCLILAAGDATRHNGGNKPLLKVGRETLLDRTYRQARQYGTDPCTVTHREDLAVIGRHSFYPEGRRWITETLLSTARLWSVDLPIVILLGDVFYTDAAMKGVFEFSGTAAFGHGCNIHALKWSPEFNGSMQDQLAMFVATTESNPNYYGAGKLWKFASDRGFHMVDFADETTDFDSPQEHKRFIEKYASRNR